MYAQRPRHNDYRHGQKPHEHSDLIIAGSGATGSTAALAAAEKGLKVTLFETSSRPGGIFAQNGGIALDGFEGDICRLMKLCGAETAARLIKISHDGIGAVRDLAEKVGAGFDQSGYVNVFRTRRQREDFLKKRQLYFDLAGDIYKPEQYTDLQRREFIGGRHYIRGAIHSPHGGRLASADLISGIMRKLSEYPNVSICMNTHMTGLEAAPGHTVRVFYKNGKMGSVTANRVFLTGDAGDILPGFPPGHQITTGMVAITNLPQKLMDLRNIRFGHVPHEGTETILPDYYRFTRDVDKPVFLFGASGRMGKNEEPLTMKDVLDNLWRISPELKRELTKYSSEDEVLQSLPFVHARSRKHTPEDHPVIVGAWARYQIFSSHDLPAVLGYDPASSRFVKFPELSTQTNGSLDLPHIPVVYVGHFGGQGIGFACNLGTLAGRMERDDYETLRLLNSLMPERPISRSEMARRIAAERNEVNESFLREALDRRRKVAGTGPKRPQTADAA